MALQQEIIQALGAKPTVDAHEEIRRSVDFLKSYLKKNAFLKSLVLGISGGQDSTLTGKLCQMAISELREETGDEKLQFIAVRLPYGVQADEQDCQDAIAFIQPDRVLTVNIKGSVLASEQALREAGIELSDFVRGNEKARERMKAQYSIAGMTKALSSAPTTRQKRSPVSSPNTATAAPILTLSSVLTSVRVSSCLPRWAVLSICIRKRRQRTLKTIALPCRMKRPLASPMTILMIIWKANSWMKVPRRSLKAGI